MSSRSASWLSIAMTRWRASALISASASPSRENRTDRSWRPSSREHEQVRRVHEGLDESDLLPVPLRERVQRAVELEPVGERGRRAEIV